MEWALTEDSSKPNLKNENAPGTEIQLCTGTTIQLYSEAAQRDTALIFFTVIILISIFFFCK